MMVASPGACLPVPASECLPDGAPPQLDVTRYYLGGVFFRVIRSLALVGLLCLVVGCSHAAKPGVTPSPRTSSVPATEPAPPKSPRPKVGGLLSGPPAAWISTNRRSFWLGYSSYCWQTACVDFIAPSCREPKHTPRFVLGRGQRVTAHLAFCQPSSG